jgi:hypothetical protein
MGGPAIMANQINALTIRSNYFEGNYQRFENWTVVTADGAIASPCTDVLINGDNSPGSLPTHASSLSLARFAAAVRSGGEVTPGRIVLSNARPCAGVVIEGNSHNPSGNPIRYCQHFAGAFVTGATGLRSESNMCFDCNKVGHQDYHGNNRSCTAVATGVAPSANITLANFQIALNAGDFAE